MTKIYKTCKNLRKDQIKSRQVKALLLILLKYIDTDGKYMEEKNSVSFILHHFFIVIWYRLNNSPLSILKDFLVIIDLVSFDL
jgi:hypothetical protein